MFMVQLLTVFFREGLIFRQSRIMLKSLRCILLTSNRSIQSSTLAVMSLMIYRQGSLYFPPVHPLCIYFDCVINVNNTKMFIIDRVAGEIIRLVASVCVRVCSSVCLCALSCLNRLTLILA